MSVSVRFPLIGKEEKKEVKVTIHISVAFLNEHVQQCGSLEAFCACGKTMPN